MVQTVLNYSTMRRQRSALNCAGCQTQITDKNTISCSTKGCNKIFHLMCVSSSGAAPEDKSIWVCPECHCSTKKGGDNSSTPVRNTERKADFTPSEAPAQVSELTSEIRLLREDITSMKAELKTAVQTLARCEERFDDFSAKMQVYESRLKAVEEQKIEMIHTITNLQAQLNSQAQQMLRNEVELTGIPEELNENPHHILMTTAVKAGLQLLETDVDFVARAGPRRRDNENRNVSRPLVIRFTRRAKRDEFHKAVKSRRLSSNDLEIKGPSQKIFANERLTHANRVLFRDARMRAKAAGYKYCWTYNGSIYIRKREGRGKGTEAIPIRCNDDLDRLFVPSEEKNNSEF